MISIHSGTASQRPHFLRENNAATALAWGLALLETGYPPRIPMPVEWPSKRRRDRAPLSWRSRAKPRINGRWRQHPENTPKPCHSYSPPSRLP